VEAVGVTIDEIDRALTARLGRPCDALHVHHALRRVVDVVVGAAVVRETVLDTFFRAELALHWEESTQLLSVLTRANFESSDGLRVIRVTREDPSGGLRHVTIEGRLA
jgi:hypothetical protein